ncbi:MAG: hypothetical protein HFJ60_03150 [Clostridia bacterium]|jgi:hypothetical protein|nr:hypothetical protein [Clostridia bacterium]
MVKIYNCQITDVKIKIRKNFDITVKLEFMYHGDNIFSIFTEKFYNAKEDDELKQIMRYANVEKIKKLNGKVVRIVLDEDKKFIGIGHAIGDVFTLFEDTNRTYFESELTK